MTAIMIILFIKLLQLTVWPYLKYKYIQKIKVGDIYVGVDVNDPIYTFTYKITVDRVDLNGVYTTEACTLQTRDNSIEPLTAYYTKYTEYAYWDVYLEVLNIEKQK